MVLPEYWHAACHALTAADPVLARIIARYEGAGLVSRGAPFETLVRSIVGQQISVKAADAVWGRLAACVGEMLPANLLARSHEELRAVGLSVRKVAYVRDLSGHFADGRINPESWAGESDEAIRDALSAVHGIGRWTAEMFLIFNLMRPDVWPVDDLGLQKAVGLGYFEGVAPTPKALREFGERFRPWRTVATWYFWRSLDPVPVEY